MRNFFNSCNGIRLDIADRIKDNKLTIALLWLFFAAGLLLGIFLKKPAIVRIYYLEYTESYYYRIFSASSGIFSIFFSRAINNLFYFAVILAISLWYYLFPLHFFIIFYRGFILGTVCVIIFSSYSVNGMVLAVLVVAPQNIITTFFMIIAMVTGIKQSHGFARMGCYSGCKNLCVWLFMLYLLSLTGALYEFIITALIIRPLNFLF